MTHKPHQFIRRLSVLSLAVILLPFTSCVHKPRKISQLPPSGDTDSESDVSAYVKKYVDSPEMFPRERLKAERTLELRLSWAMKKATDEGKIHVRAIAPPLQLTGDPIIDLTLTHNVLLVADDLKSGEKFSDVYEVRVGPSPQLATIRTARAADSLEDADKIMISDHLARLRLDRRSLDADVKFAESLGPRLTNHVEAATNAAAASRVRVELLLTNLEPIRNKAGEAETNALNEANSADAALFAARHLPETDSSKTQKIDEALDKVRKAFTSVTEARKSTASVTKKIEELEARKSELEKDEENLPKILAMMSHRENVAKAHSAGLQILESFWTDMLNKGETLSGLTNFTSLSSPPYPMNSAMVVSFRAQFLKGLQQVSIDVIRRPTGTDEKARSAAQKPADNRVTALLASLSNVTAQLPQINGLLLADEKALDLKSRQTNLKIQGDRLNDAMGTLKANIVLFTNGVSAPQTSPLPGDLTTMLGGNRPFGSMLALYSKAMDFQKSVNQNVASGSISSAEALPITQETSHLVALVSGFADPDRSSLTEIDNLKHLVVALPSERVELETTLNRIQASLSSAIPEFNSLTPQLEHVSTVLTNIQNRASALSNPFLAGQILGELTNVAAAFDDIPSDVAVLRNGMVATKERLSQVPDALKAEKAVEAEFIKSLELVRSNLEDLAGRFASGTVSTVANRHEAARSVTSLRRVIPEATTLGLGVTKARQRVMSILSGGSAVQSDGLAGSGGDAVGGDDVVAQIRQGKQAVFRLNVLRGVVSTTAYLLPDDGAAQMFGQSFANEFYAAQVTFRNPNDRPILIYGNTMRLVVRMNAAYPTGIGESGEPDRRIVWATWEPLDYDALRRMLEGIQEHSWQKHVSKVLDLASLGLGFYGVASKPSEESLRFIAAFGGTTPQLKSLLEADLKRHAVNFREKGLNNIEEIPENGTLTRYVFLPKGPIYGTFAFGVAEANELPFSAAEGRLNPFKPDSRDFGKRALQPAYIHDIRREEVYVEGKRILASDPLSSTSR